MGYLEKAITLTGALHQPTTSMRKREAQHKSAFTNVQWRSPTAEGRLESLSISESDWLAKDLYGSSGPGLF